MGSQAPNPTPFPDVNIVLEQLLVGVESVLRHHFIGLYIHGSLAGGDFNPESSDIDFLVVTLDELAPKHLPELAQMHANLRDRGHRWAARMEGSYISQASLRCYNPLQCWHPALRSDGSFAVDGHSSDWIIQRSIIREHGIVLCGPSPPSLIDPVTPSELRKATQGILNEWWAPLFQNASRLRTSEYQAYAILTMCRCLYTIETGLVASKPAAANWVIKTHGSRWEVLIQRALTWREGIELDALDETLDLVRYTMESGQK